MNRSVAMLLVGLGMAMWGCAGTDSTSPGAGTSAISKPKDGELPFPVGYQAWPTFLSDVQRPDAKQVRDIYVNPIGARVTEGRPFADGTVMVMELHKAKAEGATLATGADGKLVKGDLAKIFVMAKGDGWGQQVPDNVKNGNWIYSAFGPDGKPLAEDFTKCRACHAPLATKDFTHRLDEYLQQRSKRS